MNSAGGSVVAALFLLVAARVVHGEVRTTETARHQVCCLQAQTYRRKTTFTGKLLKDWADLLSRLFDTRQLDDGGESVQCLHVFGISNVIQQGTAGNGDPLAPEQRGDQWMAQHGVTTFSETEETASKVVQCAAIELYLQPMTTAEELLKTSVDFFTPDVLEDITRRRPRVRLEQGSGEFRMREGGLELLNYESKFSMAYSHEDAYEDSSHSKFATRDEMSTIVSKRLCRHLKWERKQCKAAFAFIEAVTGTQALEEHELGLLTKEELKNLLTAKKLESLNFGKQMKKLEKELKKLPPMDIIVGWTEHHNVPLFKPENPLVSVRQETLDKLRPSSAAKSQSAKSVSRRTDEGSSGKIYDLTFLTSSKFEAFRKNATPTALWNFRMRAALDSMQMAETFPLQRRRSRGRNTENDATMSKAQTKTTLKSGELSPRQITDFLLVNSLLAVSNTKYSDIIASAAMHKLQRAKLPIFSVCADKITWEPQLPPTGSSSGDWLSSNYRFTLAGSRHASFEYQNLNKVNSKDFPQCAVLALAGVPVADNFQELSRQPFVGIFGIFTRDQLDKEWSNYELLKEAEELKSVSAASGVDPWKLLPEKYSSSLTLGQLLEIVAERIKENGSPQWQDDAARRSSLKRWRSSRRSESQ